MIGCPVGTAGQMKKKNCLVFHSPAKHNTPEKDAGKYANEKSLYMFHGSLKFISLRDDMQMYVDVKEQGKNSSKYHTLKKLHECILHVNTQTYTLSIEATVNT